MINLYNIHKLRYSCNWLKEAFSIIKYQLIIQLPDEIGSVNWSRNNDASKHRNRLTAATQADTCSRQIEWTRRLQVKWHSIRNCEREQVRDARSRDNTFCAQFPKFSRRKLFIHERRALINCRAPFPLACGLPHQPHPRRPRNTNSGFRQPPCTSEAPAEFLNGGSLASRKNLRIYVRKRAGVSRKLGASLSFVTSEPLLRHIKRQFDRRENIIHENITPSPVEERILLANISLRNG